jgi:DNA-binding MarR family transcriptional regulator
LYWPVFQLISPPAAPAISARPPTQAENRASSIVLRYNLPVAGRDEPLDVGDHRALAEFRYQIRRFLHFSERAARAAGIEPQQHQFLLAVKGLPAEQEASVGALAERLQLKHNSVVGLVDRLEEKGLVSRERSTRDRRQVLVALTEAGEDLLRHLSLHHRAELRASAPLFSRALAKLTEEREKQ